MQMSLETFKAFLASNPEVVEKVKACSDHAEVSAIAKQNGIDVSPAELLKADMEATTELDDDDLEAVAGGMSKDAKVACAYGAVGIGLGVAYYGVTYVNKNG